VFKLDQLLVRNSSEVLMYPLMYHGIIISASKSHFSSVLVEIVYNGARPTQSSLFKCEHASFVCEVPLATWRTLLPLTITSPRNMFRLLVCSVFTFVYLFICSLKVVMKFKQSLPDDHSIFLGSFHFLIIITKDYLERITSVNMSIVFQCLT
jgi:hypothetical protein